MRPAVTWQTKVLVIANQTADSEELLAAMKDRAGGGSIAFTLLVPAGSTARDQAGTRLDSACERMRAAGPPAPSATRPEQCQRFRLGSTAGRRSSDSRMPPPRCRYDDVCRC
jgi:hypothetical protein